MDLIKEIKVPTGNIYIAKGDFGKLEFLSVGDYGKERNVKADFLGLTNKIQGVSNGNVMPLSEKWVITVSTQYGCSMACAFCDVPKVGPGRNASFRDLTDQVVIAVGRNPNVLHTKRINVHFARMGEPTFNPFVTRAAIALFGFFLNLGWHYHPVVSTMMPKKNFNVAPFLEEWIAAKNNVFDGEAGLQLSINSTDPTQRGKLFGGQEDDLVRVARMMRNITGNKPCKGRKIALNFAITDETIIDAKQLAEWFPPNVFMAKITPIHNTGEAEKNGIVTKGGYSSFYPYEKHEEELKKAGFDVIVFIPSEEEDRSRITCGNAILAD
jgi:23S rRNA (adenine2503-C2)-methyltransferase